MKKILIAISVIIASIICAVAQPAYKLTPAIDTVNSNNVSAPFAADGFLTFNIASDMPMYRVPKTGAVCSIFSGALWIGGIDAGGKLHTAAATYRQNGADFWPGPIIDSTAYSAHEDSVWNHLYKIDKSTIDSFRKGYYSSKIPASILNWPANGNPALGEMTKLAPYIDSDKNGYYSPGGGDYPLIRGDEAMFMIFNDARVDKHTESGGLKFGVEVHLMVYQFNSTDSAINQTTFMHYDIYNRSKNTYDSVYIGNWVDMDLGNGGDDMVACDSANNYWYTYNGERTDPDPAWGAPGYHSFPPAQGVVYMCDTMTHFQYYNNDFTWQGNPISPQGYYGLLKSVWRDSVHVKYYDTTATNTNYMYSGNPVTGKGWLMQQYGDVRGMGSIGPFTFAAGASRSVDLAIVFAQRTSFDSFPNIASVALLQKYVPDVRSFYNTQSYGCDSSLLAVEEVISNSENVKVYPNPGDGTFNLQLGIRNYESNEVEIYNILGEKIYSKSFSTLNSLFSIDLSAEPKGLYFYRVLSEKGEVLGTGKLIIK